MTIQGKTTTRVNLRRGPGTDQAIIRVLDAGTGVSVIEDTGEWLRVEVAGQGGFIHERFVTIDEKAVPEGLIGTEPERFGDIPLEPPPQQMIRLGPRPTSDELLAAGTWNHAGNLLRVLANHLKFDPGSAVAVFATESSGKAFGPDGRTIIRLENHHFFRHWGKTHSDVFHRHFRFNPARSWTGHKWRESVDKEFENVHRDQNGEWRAFEFARTLDDTAAKLSISMGGPQILGSNFAEAGFESVHEMFEAFSTSEKRQIIAFFDFLQGPGTHPRKVLALQKRDFTRFAGLYNGPGNAAVYGARISGLFETFERLRPLELATTA